LEGEARRQGIRKRREKKNRNPAWFVKKRGGSEYGKRKENSKVGSVRKSKKKKRKKTDYLPPSLRHESLPVKKLGSFHGGGKGPGGRKR